MNDLIRASIANVQQLKKSTFPWKLDQPFRQEYNSFTNGSWSPNRSSPARNAFTSVALYSWNIDFMLPHADSRMHQALKSLEDLVTRQSASMSSVIFLQESTPSDLDFLQGHDWVRGKYLLSDLNTDNWTSGQYGTVTLVDKRLQVLDSFRIHYENTNMERDAFFTDICLGNEILRLGNSHLESMAFEPPMRPHQVALASRYMHDTAVSGAILAGDFNAIQDFDRHLHTDNDLKDAYLELGGVEDADTGYTWGQQATTEMRRRFGCSRMDKVFFSGRLRLVSFELFGADVQLEKEDERTDIVSLGFEKPWITDHLGVKAVFETLRADMGSL